MQFVFAKQQIHEHPPAMHISHLTAKNYCPSLFRPNSVRKRAVFYATRSTKDGFVNASVGLVENKSSLGRHATSHAVVGPVLLKHAGDVGQPTFHRKHLVQCFSRLLEHAVEAEADEVIVPLRGWAGTGFGESTNLVPWGLNAEEMEAVLRDTSSPFERTVMLVLPALSVQH